MSKTRTVTVKEVQEDDAFWKAVKEGRRQVTHSNDGPVLMAFPPKVSPSSGEWGLKIGVWEWTVRNQSYAQPWLKDELTVVDLEPGEYVFGSPAYIEELQKTIRDQASQLAIYEDALDRIESMLKGDVLELIHDAKTI